MADHIKLEIKKPKYLIYFTDDFCVESYKNISLWKRFWFRFMGFKVVKL